MTRRELDHARYLNHHEQRLKRQHEYYIEHREYYLNYRRNKIIENFYETKTGQTAPVSDR